MYRAWPTSLPDTIDVCGITLPGREGLIREPAIADLLRIVERVVENIRGELDRPFAIFGHSFGAWLAFELARALRRANFPRPATIFLSARRAPSLPARESPLHTLADEALVTEIQRRYGGIPPLVLQERELLELLLPTLRADLAALETYTFVAEPPLACPIVCYGGNADRLVSLADLDAWRDFTTAEFDVRQFAGGHFYLNEASRTDLLADVEYRLLPRL